MHGSIKVLAICGVLFIGALLGVGMLLNSGHDERVEAAKELSDKRMEMFNMAMDQARQAQEMQRMHMEMMQAEMAAAEGYPAGGRDTYGEPDMYGSVGDHGR